MSDPRDPHRPAYVAPNSETSEFAAEALESNKRAAKLEQLVLMAIESAGPTGLADFEIDRALSDHLAPGGTARPRRCRLRDGDLIRSTGESVINPTTNRRQARWALASYVSQSNVNNRVTESNAPGSNLLDPGSKLPAFEHSDTGHVSIKTSDDARHWLRLIDNMKLGPIIKRLESDLSVCQGLWDRPDLTEPERLERVAARLNRAANEVERVASRIRVEAEWQATGQQSLTFDDIVERGDA
jgi:hypothetical protein